jgi:SAM-dependent methyltransferase
MTQQEWINLGAKWKTSSSKLYVLFPSLDEIMGKVSGKSILDVGCGDGVFVRRCKEKGAEAVGMDISPETIEACKKEDDLGEYLVGDIKANLNIDKKFDFVTSLFVFLSFDKKAEIITSIKNVAKLLKENGKAIIVVPHPAFEHIDNAETMSKTFKEPYKYSKKGLHILYQHKTKKEISFTDFHWMIEDYADCIRKAGMVIEDIREPLPVKESKKLNPEIYEKRVTYPPMILFVCRHD